MLNVNLHERINWPFVQSMADQNQVLLRIGLYGQKCDFWVIGYMMSIGYINVGGHL